MAFGDADQAQSGLCGCVPSRSLYVESRQSVGVALPPAHSWKPKRPSVCGSSLPAEGPRKPLYRYMLAEGALTAEASAKPVGRQGLIRQFSFNWHDFAVAHCARPGSLR